MAIRSYVYPLLCAVAACTPAAPNTDSGIDTGIQPDARPDSATPDSTSEPDASDVVDSATPTDAADATTDVPDTSVDASPDGSVPDGGGACSTYEGNTSWTARLVVESGARLCAYPASEWIQMGGEDRETVRRRALTEALARKSVITMPAGAYALPTANETRAFLLPMCVRDRSGATPIATAASAVTSRRIEGGIGISDGIYVEATFGLGAQRLAALIERPISSTTATLAAGAVASHTSGVNIRRYTTSQTDGSLYTSCAIRPTHCHSFALGAMGTLRVDEYRWVSSPGLGLGIPLRLRGTLSGTAIDLSNYDDMTGVYSHHAFDRTYFYRFAAPIGGACGVRVDFNVDDTTAVFLADCNGTPTGSALAATRSDVSCG